MSAYFTIKVTMSSIAYFSSNEIGHPLLDLIILFKTRKITFDGSNSLHEIIGLITTDADLWDRSCQVTIQRYNDSFRASLYSLINTPTQENFDVVRAFTLLFVLEIDLSVENPLVSSLQNFKEETAIAFSGRSDRAGVIAKFGAEHLPIAILKRILNSTEIGSLKNLDIAAQEVQGRISKWNTDLKESIDQVANLKSALEEQKHGFNFVGLYKGFSDMASIVTGELNSKRKRLVQFGALILSPAIIDVALLVTKKIDIDTLSVQAIISWGAISITCTAVFLYFFRILLRDIDSKEAQLVQLRLRMSLCQFVQNYASFASAIQKDNPETLARFESVIFSGIVGTQDKLPSSFDGIEQMASLVKSARGG